MSEPWHKRLVEGLAKTRERFSEQVNVLLSRGPSLDEEFWSDLEDALVGADIGIGAATEIVAALRAEATRKALPDAQAVIRQLVEHLAEEFVTGTDPFAQPLATIIMVGVNGTGKTTSIGKIAKQAQDAGRHVVLGSADTFRAAAAEQLDVLASRAGVEVIRRDRGADPAAVAYDTVAHAERMGADLTIIDTAGRLHTSTDLMRELEKVVRVTRDRSLAPVFVVLVLDATTGQNGLVQAREFNAALHLDALVLTKLDGTARGGIVLAVSRELGLPVVRVGVGEGIDDLQPFEPHEFAAALVSGA